MLNCTLRDFKLCVCNVNKGKAFAVVSCNYKIVLCFLQVFNPLENKNARM